MAVNTPVKHDLTAAVRLGLEEHGIHVRVRLDTRSFGLHELRPSLPPSAVTPALFDMFCAFEGRHAIPRRASRRHSPVAMTLLPALE